MKPGRLIVGLAVVFITTGCATLPRPPSYPTEPTVMFRSTVDMPALPPEPTMAQVPEPLESFVGIRYVPTSTAAATVGDIEVVVEPSKLGIIRTTDFKNEPLLIQPAGLIAWIVVRNQSSHIVDLGQSLLQFEDDKGNEYAIEEGGWTGFTLAFIDLVCESYAREASALSDRYRRSLDPLLVDARARVAAAQRQNDEDLSRYVRFIQEMHMPLWAVYVDQVKTWNRLPGLMGLGDPKQVDATLNPERRIVAKRQARAEADRRLEQAARSFEAEMRTRIDAVRAQLLGEIETRRAEWKKAVESLPLEATKVVQGNGRFNPIVIPPGKHRTVFVPGIRTTALSDRGPAGGPERLVLKLYDLPAQTDQAARVVGRSNLEFSLHSEPVHVFFKE